VLLQLAVAQAEMVCLPVRPAALVVQGLETVARGPLAVLVFLVKDLQVATAQVAREHMAQVEAAELVLSDLALGRQTAGQMEALGQAHIRFGALLLQRAKT
jgi:hypothetical protein